MASQITHIILAEKGLNRTPCKFDRGSFLVGTVFPDIRYLKVIDREKTHFKGLYLRDILEERDSFTAGLKYHSLVDEVREKYMVEKGIYDLFPSSKLITQALKAYEDEVLYSNVSDWNQVVAYLDKVLPEETELVEQMDKVKAWHSLMQRYFKEAPTNSSRKNFILGIGFPKEIVIEINKLSEQLRLIPKVREIILGLYEDWNLLVKGKNRPRPARLK